jgi:hypothetical protein
MNYLPRIQPNPLHGRGPSERPYPTSLQVGSLWWRRGIADERNKGLGWRGRWMRRCAGGGGGGRHGAVRLSDLFQVQRYYPIRVS